MGGAAVTGRASAAHAANRSEPSRGTYGRDRDRDRTGGSSFFDDDEDQPRRRSGGGGGGRGTDGPKGPGGGKGPKGKGKGNPRKKRRRRRIALIAGLTALLVLFGGLGAGYAALQVPLPAQLANKQVTKIYYSDGKTELASMGTQNRTDVSLSQIPKSLQRAVLAAEDQSFYENSGFSPVGIIRAFWSTVTGGEVQGGSTITQQYVKNAYLTQERTVTRKLKEIVLALKIEQEYSKDQILEFYLNTIYFGRGAYGIQAASKAYFGKDVSKLTTGESAVIAGVIKAPAFYDPRLEPGNMHGRFKYVIGGMLKQHWITPAEAASVQEATTVPRVENNGPEQGLDGWKGVIVKRVEKELTAQGSDITEQELRTGGLAITTTIDKKAQDATVRAVKDVFSEQPKNLAKATVTVEPGTGKVKAYYGGEGGYGGYDLAKAEHPPGSSFKAYALAEAIDSGVSIKSVWNGKDNVKFEGDPRPVKNSDGASCENCTLIEATEKSLNTTFYALVKKAGADKVIERAYDSGITSIDGKKRGQLHDVGIRRTALGEFTVSVLDQADGFATFANKGEHVAPYFVQKVEKKGSIRYQAPTAPEKNQAFSEDVAADATFAMQSVVKSAKGGQLDGREAAGKTGTAQYKDTGTNAHAWMAGYTPQLSTAVWVGNKGDDGTIKTSSGKNIYGSGLPYDCWKKIMDGALEGKDSESLPPPKYLGSTDLGDTEGAGVPPEEKKDPKPSQSGQPSQGPSQNPSPSPSFPSDPNDPGNGGALPPQDDYGNRRPNDGYNQPVY